MGRIVVAWRIRHAKVQRWNAAVGQIVQILANRWPLSELPPFLTEVQEFWEVSKPVDVCVRSFRFGYAEMFERIVLASQPEAWCSVETVSGRRCNE